MKTQAISMEQSEMNPQWSLELYQDTNGNWFAAASKQRVDGSSHICTATYTDPHEAIEEAKRRLPICP